MRASPKMILKLIEESGVGFSNARSHEDIKQRVITFGYSDEKLDEFLTLNAGLADKYQAFEKVSGEQLEATTKLDEKYRSESHQYSVYRQIARKLFVGDNFRGMRSQMGIDMGRRRNFEGFIEQAIQFYQAALDNQEVLPGILKISLTPEKIQERLAALSELKQLNDNQESAKGKALVSRRERDDLYLELRKAWENYKIICRHEFRDNEEYLKILNIKPKKKRSGNKTPVEDQEEPQPEQPE